MKVIPWTINDEDDFRRLIHQLDVDGINTDHPDRMVALIEAEVTDGP